MTNYVFHILDRNEQPRFTLEGEVTDKELRNRLFDDTIAAINFMEANPPKFNHGIHVTYNGNVCDLPLLCHIESLKGDIGVIPMLMGWMPTMDHNTFLNWLFDGANEGQRKDHLKRIKALRK